MSEPLILLLLAALVLVLLALPFVRRRGAPPAPARGAVFPRVEAAEDDPAALALQEIELDREMGKLSEADYLALKAKYEAARRSRPAPPVAPAAVLTEQITSAAAPDAARAQGEAGDRAGLDWRAEALVRRWRQESVRCPDCGERPEPDARYCSHCGRVLVPCPRCGSDVNEPGARFCTRCGAVLAA